MGMAWAPDTPPQSARAELAPRASAAALGPAPWQFTPGAPGGCLSRQHWLPARPPTHPPARPPARPPCPFWLLRAAATRPPACPPTVPLVGNVPGAGEEVVAKLVEGHGHHPAGREQARVS